MRLNIDFGILRKRNDLSKYKFPIWLLSRRKNIYQRYATRKDGVKFSFALMRQVIDTQVI